MNEIREILENLARVSHQSRGTDSYYTIVEKTLSEIKKKIEGMKKEIDDCKCGDRTDYDVKSRQYNVAIDDIASMFGDKS